MTLNESEIAQFVADIWEWQLGLLLQRSSRKVAPGTEDMYEGHVTISGAWQGTIVLLCSTAQVRQAAAILFNIEPQTVSDVQARDALGELTNIIGGNVKPFLPQPAQMSLPVVTEGLDVARSVPGQQLVTELGFELGRHPFMVRVYQEENTTCEIG